MRTIETNFKRAGKYFKVSMLHLFEPTLMAITCGIMKCVHVMNGYFGERKLKKPLLYIWRVLSWSSFAFVMLTYVMAPFFEWWSGVVIFLNYVIWG